MSEVPEGLVRIPDIASDQIDLATALGASKIQLTVEDLRYLVNLGGGPIRTSRIDSGRLDD